MTNSTIGYKIKTVSPITVCSPASFYRDRLSVALPRFLFDAESDKNDLVLEAHFNDVYMTLMKKLADFALKTESSETEHTQLRKLMDELVRVRNLMQK